MHKKVFLKAILDGLDLSKNFEGGEEELKLLNEQIREILSKKLKYTLSHHFEYQFKRCDDELCLTISKEIISDIFLKIFKVNVNFSFIKFKYVKGIENIILNTVLISNFDSIINKHLLKIKHQFFLLK